MSIVFDPRRSISGVRCGASSVVQADRGTNHLRTTGGLQVHLDDEVSSGSIGHGYASRAGALPGAQPRKCPSGNRAWHVHARKARYCSLAARRRTSACVVEKNARMVKNAGIAGTELEPGLAGAFGIRRTKFRKHRARLRERQMESAC
jgi:hypothetical protein